MTEATAPAGNELSVTCHIAAPPERVWRAMRDELPEWWCPRPWRTEIVEQDRRPGGASRLIMKGPNGEENRVEGIYLRWDEGTRFAITDAIDENLMPGGPFMIGIFEIAPEDGGTRYTARARHWSSETMEEHKRMGFHEGWGKVADQLKALCETGSVPD